MDWGSVPDWIVAVTAVVGAAFAASQLVLIRRADEKAAEAQQDYLVVERANLLKGIDDKFESSEMLAARSAMMIRIRAIESRFSDKSADARFNLVADEYSSYLTSLYRTVSGEGGATDEPAKAAAQAEYFELMKLPNYVETMGWLWTRKLVQEDDLLDLYDAVIVQVIGMIGPHMRWRRSQRWPLNQRYLSLAEDLFTAAQDYKDAREKPAKPRPTTLRDKAI